MTVTVKTFFKVTRKGCDDEYFVSEEAAKYEVEKRCMSARLQKWMGAHRMAVAETWFYNEDTGRWSTW